MIKKYALFSILLLFVSLFSNLGEAVNPTVSVVITPQNPTAGDDLTCTVLINNQASPLIYQYTWEIGLRSVTGKTIHTTPNDANQQAICTAENVLFGGGTTIVGSSTPVLLTKNPTSPPTGTVQIIITPQNPTAGDDLTCTVLINNQASPLVYQYTWHVDQDLRRGDSINQRLLHTSPRDENKLAKCLVEEPVIGSGTITIGSASVLLLPATQTNNAPIVQIISPPNNYDAQLGNDIPLQVQANDPDTTDSISEWEFNFGDSTLQDTIRNVPGTSTNAREERTEHITYTTVGQKIITVRAKDNHGLWSDPTSITLTVRNPNVFIINTLKVYEDSFFRIEQTNFFRGKDLYARFRVTDQAGNPVDELQIDAQLQDPTTGVVRQPLAPYDGFLGKRDGSFSLERIRNGQKDPLCLPFVGCIGSPDGIYYYEIPELSKTDDILGSNTVLAIAIRGLDEGRAQTSVTVLNNPPQIGCSGLRCLGSSSRPIPDQHLTVGGSPVTLSLDDHVFDVEDLPSQMSWGIPNPLSIVNVHVDPATRTVTLTPLQEGQVTLTFTVTDTDHGVDHKNVNVFVGRTTGLQAPNALISVTSTTACVNTLVDLSGARSSDVDGQIVAYTWDFGDSTTGSGVSGAHTYITPGIYTVHLTATDNDGLRSQTASIVLTLNNCQGRAPVADFIIDRPTLLPHELETFTSTSYDLDGQIVNYAWNFGDGATLSGASTVTHTYAVAGSYTVTLTVTDNDGLTSSTNKIVTVRSETIPPSQQDHKRRRFAFQNVPLHDFAIRSIQAFPFKTDYSVGDRINLFVTLENQGQVDEDLELHAVIAGMNVPDLEGTETIATQDTKLNNNLGFVIPQGSKSGTYVVRLEVKTNGGTDHKYSYFVFTLK